MGSEYFYTMSILVFSHMYTTYPFSCNLMCSINNYVSGTKWTYCTVLSNKQSKQIIFIYYCSNIVTLDHTNRWFKANQLVHILMKTNIIKLSFLHFLYSQLITEHNNTTISEVPGAEFVGVHIDNLYIGNDI